VSLIVLPLSLACVAEGLAWVAPGEHVDALVVVLDVLPVHGRDVAEVWHAGVMRGEDRAGGWLDLGVPGEGAAIDVHDGSIQTAVATEEASDFHAETLDSVSTSATVDT
jgi:hypothetical protein